MHHRSDESWLRTTTGDPRGYIETAALKELWFHTGTICNLQCPDCYEHSGPGDQRLQAITLADAKPFIDEAVELGVQNISFTGGEPFVVREFVDILDYALNHRPCLVLTNATQPLKARLAAVRSLLNKPHQLSFRVSLDFPDPARHDAQRGAGMFQLALDTMSELASTPFPVSIARHREDGEDTAAVDAAYQPFFSSAGLPAGTPIISFPDLQQRGNPEITENCMRTYHTAESRAKFMCAFSRMVVKQNGKMCVYACTLVDDHPHYDLGGTLAESIQPRVMLEHPRCFFCFAGGTSCSEL